MNAVHRLLDPGRVKRGILPNEQMGRSLVAGRRYTLVVSREWRDAEGLPLKEEFRLEFRVGPPDERPLEVKTWKVDSPGAQTEPSARLTSPEPLDRWVVAAGTGRYTTAAGADVRGDVRIESDETRWMFIRESRGWWGTTGCSTLTFLEDSAGNRIGRAFEVDSIRPRRRATGAGGRPRAVSREGDSYPIVNTGETRMCQRRASWPKEPAARRRSALVSVRGFVGVVRAAHQRAGFDVDEAQIERDLL